MYRTTSTTIVRFTLALVLTLGVLAGVSPASYAGGGWPSNTRNSKTANPEETVETQPVFIEQFLFLLGTIF
jgi:hypothetical protein